MAVQAKEEPWDKVEEAYLDAYKYCKDRAEPLYRIAIHYMWINEYQLCYKYAKKAESISYPHTHLLFVDSSVYSFGVKDIISVAAYHIGKYHESYSIAKQLLDNTLVPEKQLERVKNNLRLAQIKITELDKKLCCIYANNQFISNKSDFVTLIKNINQTHKVLIIGEKIENLELSDIVVCTVSHAKSLKQSINVDYLILYDSFNYFIDNPPITSKNIILLLSKAMFSITSFNNFDIEINNPKYLNEYLKKINNIVCTSSEIISSISSKHKVPSEQFNIMNISDANETYKLFDDVVEKYQSSIQINNILNGLIYYPPKYMAYMINNHNIFQPSKQMVIKHYEQIVSDFPSFPENYHHLASLHINYKNYDLALINLENAQKILKNKKFTSYGDCILTSKASILSKTKKYDESYILANDILKRNLIPESQRELLETIRDSNIEYLKNNYLRYSQPNINNIFSVIKNKKNINVALAITIGETFETFEKTINSFINCCSDLNKIDYWFSTDELTSMNDQPKIKKTYPFLNLLNHKSRNKTISCTNAIRNEAISKGANFLIYIESGNFFVQKKNYVSESLKIFSEDNNYGQVLFNRNYQDDHKEKKYGGTIKYTNDGLRYVLHEYDPVNSTNSQQSTVNSGLTCSSDTKSTTLKHWPHFSIKPSVIRVSALEKIGLFTNSPDYEKEFALDYVANGFKTVFFDTFSHQGKNIKKIVTQNENELSVKILSRNETNDQWNKFKTNAIDKLASFSKHVPQFVNQLNEYEKQIFLGNKFNYDRKIISEIIYYLDLFKNNTSQNMMVLRDTMIINNNFSSSFEKLMYFIKSDKYDIILLNQDSQHENFNKLNNNMDINFVALGGFIVSQDGCKKIIENITKITNYDDITKIFQNDNLKIYEFTDQFYNIDPGYTFVQVDRQKHDLPGYTFYSQLDSFGNDLGYFAEIEIEKLCQICEEKKCVGFNTLGWIKNKIDNEENFIHLPNSQTYGQGLYVKN